MVFDAAPRMELLNGHMTHWCPAQRDEEETIWPHYNEDPDPSAKNVEPNRVKALTRRYVRRAGGVLTGRETYRRKLVRNTYAKRVENSIIRRKSESG